ncbi:hypothetical protein ACLOJK_022227 [Asimina triloba]
MCWHCEQEEARGQRHRQRYRHCPKKRREEKTRGVTLLSSSFFFYWNSMIFL